MKPLRSLDRSQITNDKRSTCQIYPQSRPKQKKRLEAFVNNPNIKAISIITYERGFVALYQEARSNLRKRSLHEDKDSKKAFP
ncbi:MAG: hypothetical protein ACRD8Z_09380 [Nitrososphaeraceae archaeon]